MEGWVRSRWATVIFIALLLPACTENAELFRSLDEPEVPSLDTVEAGSVISPDETLSVQLQYPEEDMSRATSLSVELRTPEGEVVGELSFTEEQLLEPELPPIELPRPADGPYVLYVKAMRGEEILFVEERQLFVIVTPPQIRSIGVYPSTIASDAKAVAVAELISSTSLRPYLQWYFQGTLIGEGYVDDGSDRMPFSPGGHVGVHTVRVELFPWGPDEGVRLDQGSTVTAETEAFVRTDAPVDPPGEYTVLRYLLDGRTAPDTDRLDRTFRPIAFDPDERLDLRTERLGYTLSSGGALTVPYDLLPSEGEGRRVRIGLMGDNDRGGGLTLSIGNANEALVTITLDDAALATLEHGGRITDLQIHNEERRVSYAPFPRNLSFSLFRNDGRLFVVPELPGSEFPVLTVEERGSRNTRPLELAYDGEGALFVDEIVVHRYDDAALLLPRDALSFAYYPGEDEDSELSEPVQVDLGQSVLQSDLSEGWFLLWIDGTSTPRYIAWRERDEIRIATINNASEAPPTTPNALRADAIVPSAGEGITVRQGDAFETTAEAITLPEPGGGVWFVRSGRFSSRGNTSLSPLHFVTRPVDVVTQ